MVDLGPLGPWSGLPSMAIPTLERWHAAWERDHLEMLGLAGPSFYEPGMDSTSLLPTVAGIRPSEVRQILHEMGVPTATKDEIDRHIIRAARQQEREIAEYRAAFRRFPTKGGYPSGDIPAYRLSPIPDALMEKPEAQR